MFAKKKDIIASLICGEIASWFLILIIKNPYIEELTRLLILEKVTWWLPVVVPVVFAIGVLVGKILSKILKIFYQMVKFAEVGALNTIMDFGILNLLIWVTGVTGGWAIAPLNMASFMCAVVNSYFWNKHWTFEKGEKATSKEFTQFLIVSIVGIGINTGIMVVGTSLIPPLAGLSVGTWANIMKATATLVSMVWNFAGYKFFVFKK